MTEQSNPFRQALEKRSAEKRAAVASVSDDDLNAVIRMLAVGAAAGDARALDKIAAAGPDMRAIIEAEVERVATEQRHALDQRRAAAGVTAVADSSRPVEAIHPAPHYENAPAATANSVSAHVMPPGCRPRLDGRPDDLPPPGTTLDYSGRTRPVPPPEFSAKRYGLKEVTRGESNTGWMGNR